jgi:hypothetical protein
MWSVLMVAVLTALTAFYTNVDTQAMATLEQTRSAELADSMALYRNAAIDYFSRHPDQTGSVAIGTLIGAGSLPAWSALAAHPENSIWAAYRDANGLIYVYSTSVSRNIASEVIRLASNSLMAGIYRKGDTTLYSPAFGDTRIKLPAAGTITIPDGSPVWVAGTRTTS